MHPVFWRMRAFVFPAVLLSLCAAAPGQPAAAARSLSHPARVPQANEFSSDWPGFHRGPDGDGWNPVEHILSPANAGKLTLQWADGNPGGPDGSPIVSPTAVYDVTTDFQDNQPVSHLVDINRSDGKPVWTTRLDSPGAMAVVGDGRVFVSTSNGLEAFRASTGQFLWRRLDGFAWDATMSGGVLYTGSSRDGVEAIDPQNGKLHWARKLPAAVSSTVAVAGNEVYAAAFGTQRLYALSTATGRVLWSTRVGYVFGGGPAIVGGTLYIAADTGSDSGGTLLALRASDGRLLWRRPAGDDVHAIPGVDETDVVISSIGGQVFDYAAKTGDLRWSRTVDGEVWDSIALANGLAFLVNSDTGQTYGLSTSDGKVDWTAAPPQCCTFSSQASPAVSKATVYVGYGQGGVRAYTLSGMLPRRHSPG